MKQETAATIRKLPALQRTAISTKDYPVSAGAFNILNVIVRAVFTLKNGLK